MRASDLAGPGSGLARRAVLAQHRAKFEAIAVHADGGRSRRVGSDVAHKSEINRVGAIRTSITL